MSELVWLDPSNTFFPPTSEALEDPNGLLAVGGDLSTPRLLAAYKLGIFPWFDDSQPILWWTPNPRMVLIPSQIHYNRTLRKLANKRRFTVTIDTEFERVIEQCSSPSNREGEDAGTWITHEMQEAYLALHHEGAAHSVEVWQGDELVGGLYGVCVNYVFYGESMFSRVSGASKIGFATLATQLNIWEFLAIDCQIQTAYLASFGAREIPRNQFEELLEISSKKGSLDNIPLNWKKSWNMPAHGITFKNGEIDLE